MRDASPQPTREVSRCQCCGAETVIAVEGLFRYPEPGSPRRFCSPACRQRAHRRRQAGVAEATPVQPRGGRNRSLEEAKEVTPTAN